MMDSSKIKVMPTAIRLDTWLWAARCFRTRRLANLAIKGGKVHIGRNLGKAGQNIKIGMQLTIRQGYDKRKRPI